MGVLGGEPGRLGQSGVEERTPSLGAASAKKRGKSESESEGKVSAEGAQTVRRARHPLCACCSTGLPSAPACGPARIVLRRMLDSFPPGVAHRLLLSALAAAID